MPARLLIVSILVDKRVNRLSILDLLNFLEHLLASETVFDKLINRLLQVLHLSHLLLKDLLVVLLVVGQSHLVPFMTDPALRGVHPELTLLNLVIAKHSRKNDLIHVACHRVLY